MTFPNLAPKRLVIIGATGMVGGYALRYALDNPAVENVTTIGRKKLGIPHPKLKRFCIKTSQTVPRAEMYSRVRMRRSIAWGPIPGYPISSQNLQCPSEHLIPELQQMTAGTRDRDRKRQLIILVAQNTLLTFTSQIQVLFLPEAARAQNTSRNQKQMCCCLGQEVCSCFRLRK